MSQEKTRSALGSIDRGEGEPEALTRLRALLRAAGEAQGSARTELAGEINRTLAKIREPGHESDEARLLVSELDAHAFDDLLDAQGVSSRKEAVNTLLSLGFPHALNVDPGDLAFARKEQILEQDRQRQRRILEPSEGHDDQESAYLKKVRRMRFLAFCFSLTSVALFFFSPLLFSGGSPIAGTMAIVQALLAAGSTGYLWRVNPPLHEQATPVVGVVFAALLALVLIPDATWVAGIAAFGSVAALAALIGWQYDDPRRDDGFFPPGHRRGKNPFDDSGQS